MQTNPIYDNFWENKSVEEKQKMIDELDGIIGYDE